jgi:hypothetical protein
MIDDDGGGNLGRRHHKFDTYFLDDGILFKQGQAGSSETSR